MTSFLSSLKVASKETASSQNHNLSGVSASMKEARILSQSRKGRRESPRTKTARLTLLLNASRRKASRLMKMETLRSLS